MTHGGLSYAGIMEGLTLRGCKKNPALIPLHFFLALGLGWGAFYITRLAVKNPDCAMNRGDNPYPWQRLGVNGQYKMWSETIDYKALKAPVERPHID